MNPLILVKRGSNVLAQFENEKLVNVRFIISKKGSVTLRYFSFTLQERKKGSFSVISVFWRR